LHLQDVHDGVDGPTVARRERERALGGRPRLRVLVALLEAERVHAEDVRVARHTRAPARQHARDAVAKVRSVAAEEVEQVRGLEREGISRVVDEHTIEGRARLVPVAIDEAAGRRDQQALAIVGGAGKLLGGPHAVAREQGEPLLAGRHQDAGAKHVPHHEVGPRRQRALDRRDGVANIALVLA
jgi:hypothetical protein